MTNMKTERFDARNFIKTGLEKEDRNIGEQGNNKVDFNNFRGGEMYNNDIEVLGVPISEYMEECSIQVEKEKEYSCLLRQQMREKEELLYKILNSISMTDDYLRLNFREKGVNLSIQGKLISLKNRLVALHIIENNLFECYDLSDTYELGSVYTGFREVEEKIMELCKEY
ncbi:hypothetical protein COE50_10870 [Bacillus anthracis]|nr:hypothetical protein COE50_10870 [Bacillus anthracis]